MKIELKPSKPYTGDPDGNVDFTLVLELVAPQSVDRVTLARQVEAALEARFPEGSMPEVIAIEQGYTGRGAYGR